MRQLEESLRRLKTDHLDLWQIARVRLLQRSRSALRARRRRSRRSIARSGQGKVRFVGFTGHKDPEIHLRMLSFGYPFDACQLPLNVFDASFRSFEQRVLPELRRQRIAPIGMKSLCGHAEAIKKRVVSAADALRYAMSLPVATTVSGIDSMKVLKQNVRIAQRFQAVDRRADGAAPPPPGRRRRRRALRALQDDRGARRRRRSPAARLPATGGTGRLRRHITNRQT